MKPLSSEILPVQLRCDELRPESIQDLSDLVRVPSQETRIVDTIAIWQYPAHKVSSGEYGIQFDYIFPQSRVSRGDGGMVSPVADEKAIGEFFCMVLRGRFESNILPVYIK
jgi:hypothetical protein